MPKQRPTALELEIDQQVANLKDFFAHQKVSQSNFMKSPKDKENRFKRTFRKITKFMKKNKGKRLPGFS